MANTTSDNIKIRLCYWDTRGRAQAVRYMLEDIAAKYKNVDYNEDFEILKKAPELWSKHKADLTVSGPFQNIPVLHWNDTHTFGQTLTIAQFLARNFDLYGQLTSSINDKNVLQAYIDGVVSCSYIDIINPVLTCINNSLDFDNPNDQNMHFTKSIPSALRALNNLLQKSSTSFFYDQTEPTIADYFAFEAYTVARDYHSKVLPNEDDCQALKKLEQIMRQRSALANYFNQGLLFKRFAGSPKEEEYLAKLDKTKN